MLAERKFDTLRQLIAGSSRDELIWINGYLSGLVQQHAEPAPAANPATTNRITFLFGTETGNSKKLATGFAAAARQKGIPVKLAGLDHYSPAHLEKEAVLLLVVSTQGDGEPPLAAKSFYDFVMHAELPLPKLRYAVLALGDSTYPQFCKTGTDLDTRLEALGASRIQPVLCCDVDYEADAQQWFAGVLSAAVTGTEKPVGEPAIPATPKTKKARTYHKGIISRNINLNDMGSGKQTFHIEIIPETPVGYQPGDALAIIPENKLSVVEKIIALLGATGTELIQTSRKTTSLKELLHTQVNICYLMGSTIKKYASLTHQHIPDTRMDLIDLLRIYPLENKAQLPELMNLLTPIAPRLYSLSSAPAAHDNEIHLTVSKRSFLARDEERFGLCSEFLGDLPIGSTVHFYIHPNRAFKLPAPEKDIIMIGPGTGIAPFRSFLAERNATGATGRNWLFFGEQHFVTDFLYQREIQQFVATGVINRIDLAFSRDQPQKIYVQHHMQTHASEVYQWIANGASVYISGTREPMGREVEACLVEILKTEGKLDAGGATSLLKKLQDEGRYAKDVY